MQCFKLTPCNHFICNGTSVDYSNITSLEKLLTNGHFFHDNEVSVGPVLWAVTSVPSVKNIWKS